MKKYLMTVGDVDSGEIFFILAFKKSWERYDAERIMLEHRRDNEDMWDTYNMINALENSGLEYDMYEGQPAIYEMWF